jgi:Tfp pilus assembly protein FimT
VTLIELLVVVSIMLMVTVIAVPAMKPALENRKIREAAREVNVYLGSAHNHAVELGRPVGVFFTRDSSTQGNPCATLQQIDIPAPYAGDTIGTTASVTASPSSPNSNGTPTAYTVQITFNGSVNTNLFHAGDYIQFNLQGPLYTITGASGSSATATITLPPNGALPWPSPPQGVLFQITRLPDFSGNVTLATQSAVAPLQLPAGTVIDLQTSGTNNLQAAGTSPYAGFGVNTATLPNNVAMLLFSPAGGVYAVYANGVLSPLIDPVYFLIGRRDRMYLPVDNLANWQDPSNLWVSVTPQTGRITTVENAVVAGAASPTNAAITAARYFALQGQSKGGR